MAKVKFGLEAQGHIGTVEEKLKTWYPRCSDENKFQVWREIGDDIGWIDYAVCQSYIDYLRRNSKKAEKELAELRGEVERLKGWKETAIKEHPQLAYTWQAGTR